MEKNPPLKQMGDLLTRAWENLIGRLDGPLHFRLIVQPAMAALLAILAGLRDVRDRRSPFFWTVLSNSARRGELLKLAWNNLRTLLIAVTSLDVIYQLIVHRGVYLLELMITVTVLAILPYILIRGPVTRIIYKLGNLAAGGEARSQSESPPRPLLKGDRNR